MSDPADLLIYNARIYTVEEKQPTATAMAVRNGRFLTVGTDNRLQRICGAAVRIDAWGRTIVPGFNDAHAHLHELVRRLRRADLSDTISPTEVVDRLETVETERDIAPGTSPRGHGWDETEWWDSELPSRTQLDGAFPHRPVWLTRADLHAGWANTTALERTVGVDRVRRMDDPEGGQMHRTSKGTPTGILIDSAMALVEDELPSPSNEQSDCALRKALQYMSGHGIMGLHDAGVTLNEIRRFQRFIDEDAFPLRVYAMIAGRGDTFDHFRRRGPFHDDAGRLHVESVKYVADGALGSRGAALLDDYADDPGNRGWLLQDQEEFHQNVQAAVEAGFQVNAHAIGDCANRFVLDAYETAMAACEAPDCHPRIEHAQVLAPEEVDRFGELGVLASMQPLHVTSDMRWVEPRLCADRTTRAHEWKRLLDAGARLAFGSDAPVEPIDPLRGFHAAVTRQDVSGKPTRWLDASERLSRSAALHAYTKGGAYAAFREDEVGSIKVGKRADFVVLSTDIMTENPRHRGRCNVY